MNCSHGNYLHACGEAELRESRDEALRTMLDACKTVRAALVAHLPHVQADHHYRLLPDEMETLISVLTPAIERGEDWA